MKLSQQFRIALLSGAALIAGTAGASAQDADDFLAKVKSAYATFGYVLDFGPATSDGDTIVVDGVTISITGMPEMSGPMTIPTELTFTGVTQEADGSYFVDELTVPDVDVTVEEAHITAQAISFRDLYVPGSATPSMVEGLQILGQFSAGPLQLDVEGQTFLTIESFAAENQFLPEVGPDITEMTSVATIDGFVANLGIIPEPEAQAVIAALGLETVTGSFRESLNWTMADGRMVVDEFAFDFDDVGRLGFTFDIVGYTPALLQQMADAQKQMADLTAAGDTAGLQQLQQTMAMTMLGQLSIGGFSIRYDDASLAGKVLEFFAAQQNLSAADLANALKQLAAAQIPPELGPELGGQIGEAVNAFLDDPQSFEISMSPSEPINIMMLGMMAQQPQQLIPMLAISVTANQS